MTFHRTRFVSDVAVSGRVVWRRRGAVVAGALRVEGPNLSGTLRIAFGTDRRGVGTTIRGHVDARWIDLTMPGVWSP